MERAERACFFTGHRILPPAKLDAIKTVLHYELIKHIAAGITTFISGGALGFDTIAAQQVLELKKDDARIKLRLYIPYRHFERRWREQDIIAYHRIMGMADAVQFISDTYTPACIRQRNEALVQDAECGIAFQLTGKSGTGQTTAFARMYGREVVNIADIIYK